MSTTEQDRIFAEVIAERLRQDEKFGVQNHPSVTRSIGGRDPQRFAEDMEIPTANRARFITNSRFGPHKDPNWAVVAVEELAEVVEAAVVGGDQVAREELIQLAAVCFAWIECIDRADIVAANAQNPIGGHNR